MKRWLKWIVIAVVVALLALGVLRALSARKATKEALESQQAAQKAQPTIALTATDSVQAKTMELSQGLAISGSLKAASSAFVKARVAGELQGLTVREGDFVKVGQVIAHVDPQNPKRARARHNSRPKAPAPRSILRSAVLTTTGRWSSRGSFPRPRWTRRSPHCRPQKPTTVQPRRARKSLPRRWKTPTCAHRSRDRLHNAWHKPESAWRSMPASLKSWT